MKKQVVGTVTFGPSVVEQKNLMYSCKRTCLDCGTILVEAPLDSNGYVLLHNTFHAIVPTFCPKCDRVVACKECGTKKIVHEPKGRVVEQEDTGDLKSPAKKRAGSTPAVPTKKRRGGAMKRGRQMNTGKNQFTFGNSSHSISTIGERYGKIRN